MTSLASTIRGPGVLPSTVSLDAVPSHLARRRPVGSHRFQQPAPGMFGREGNALGLSGADGQRIQPERLPAVVEPIEQPEMMAMEVEDSRKLGAIGEGQDHGAAG